MKGDRTIRDKQIRLQTENGYVVVDETAHVTIMKKDNDYIKVDDEGMVTMFTPLNEQRYQTKPL